MTDRPMRFHLSLKARPSTFESMIAFYTSLFGAPPVKRKPDYAKFDVAEPSVNFTLNVVPEFTPGEIDHLGIQVWSDATLDAARTRLREAGLAVLDEPDTECCYAGQNKFWVTDPDGRQVEFFHVLHDIEQHGKKRSLATVASACCAPGTSCG